MILFITTIDLEGQLHKFSCSFKKLQEALDFLEYFQQSADQVIDVSIVEVSGRRFNVPLEMLDEEAEGSPVQQLKKQWESALKVEEDKLGQTRQTIKQRWLENNQSRAEYLQNALSRVIEQLVIAQDRLPDGVSKNALINSYKRLLDRYEIQLKRLEDHFLFR